MEVLIVSGCVSLNSEVVEIFVRDVISVISEMCIVTITSI